MKNIIRFTMSALLALGFAYAAKSQACGGEGNTIVAPKTSSALGTENTVSAPNCTAMGSSNSVSGDNSIVMGMNNIVYGKNSVATGLGNMVYGKGSAAFGTNNTVMIRQYPDYSAYALGDQNTVSHIYSFAFGQKNTVSEGYSFAIGTDNKVNANTSIALGYCLKNSKKYGITIGVGRSPSLPLVNNTDGIMMGMNSDKPTFFISRSETDGGTGRVGIGNVTSPQAKLHIKADNYSYDGEDADILLEPTRANKIAVIYFKDKNNSISVSSNNKMYFNAGEYNFVNGVIRAEADILLEPTRTDKKAAIYFKNADNSISVFANQMIFAAPKYTFTNAGITLGKNATTQSPEISFGGQGGGISVGTDKVMSFATGKVGIGCENTVEGYALAVNGGVVSTRVSVMDVDAWPDYVFGSDYERMSLYELEEYIGLNHHLPEVPSAEEVAEQGIDLGEMNALLLQKVEELTLHVIELQKQIDTQQNEINELKAK